MFCVVCLFTSHETSLLFVSLDLLSSMSRPFIGRSISSQGFAFC